MKRNIAALSVAGALAIAGFTFSAFAQDSSPAAPEPKGDAWPLSTCVVTGEPLGEMGDPVVHTHEGREVRFCCAPCEKPFSEDPAKYLKAADEKIADAQRADYPLDTCVVAGGELGSMGDPYEIVYKNRLVRFCCKGCDKKFLEAPAEGLAAIDAAVVAKQKPDYPLSTCVVSGEALGSMGDPVELVHANRLVRLCCKGCLKQFRKDPAGHIAKIDAAQNES